jgi:heat shock protein HslJ
LVAADLEEDSLMPNKTTGVLPPLPMIAMLAIASLSCGPKPPAPEGVSGDAPATAAASVVPLTLESIADATIEGIYDEPIQLQAGRYEGEPFDPEGASRPTAGLAEDFLLTGDLDGDGVEEAVALLWETSGGSGTFTYLAVFAREGDGVVNSATAEIGDARINGHKVELDVIRAGAEDAACCPGEMATLAWSYDGDTLTLVDAGVEPSRLSVAALAGPEWVLKKFGWNEPAPTEPEITLLFEEGRIAGGSGCNRYMGQVTEGEMPGDLLVGLLAGTMMACPPEIMELEDRYRQDLEKVVKYGFLNRHLILTFEKDGGDIGTLFFAPREPGA